MKPTALDPTRADLARRALDWPRVTLEELATDLGCARSTLAAYRQGQRPLPASVAHDLAAWLRRRAADSLNLAAELDRVE